MDRLLEFAGPLWVALGFLLLLCWWDRRQMRRAIWERYGRPLQEQSLRAEAERKREAAERERTRTHWSSTDAGFGYKFDTVRMREAERPDQPWNYRRLWQGLAHSSARSAMEQLNAELADRLRHNREEHRRMIQRDRHATGS